MVEYLDLVDSSDNVIGKRERLWFYLNDCHNYRVVNVFLVDSIGKIYIPKRGKDATIFPECYDFSVGGHVKSGETYEQAVIREIREELGIHVTSKALKEIGYFLYPNMYKTSSFSKLFVLDYRGERIEREKGIVDADFYDEREVKQMLLERPFKSDFNALFNYYISMKKDK